MTGVVLTAQERLSGIRRYSPGGDAPRRAGKLSANESPLGPSPLARRAIARVAGEAHRYATSHVLQAQLASALGLAAERVVLTNGSDELCYLIATVFLTPGAPVVLSDPCYRIDEIVTRVQHGEPRFVPLASDGGHDLDAMAEAASDAALVWLPSPHNPTGVASSADALHDFLSSVPGDCLVVLDEAYRGYVDRRRRPDANALLAEFPNLVVERTFSKDFGLAGLRVGYGLGDPALISLIDSVKAPFNVNVAGLAAAGAALSDEDWREYGVTLVRRERTQLERTLTELGIEHYKSDANFVTARVPAKEEFLDRLYAAGLSVRDGAELGLHEWLRITIGSPAQMVLLRALLTQHKEQL